MSYDTLTLTPGAVRIGSVLLFPYPSGRVAQDYEALGAYITVGAKGYRQDEEVFSLSYESAGARVVWGPADTIAAGQEFTLKAPLTREAGIRFKTTVSRTQVIELVGPATGGAKFRLTSPRVALIGSSTTQQNHGVVSTSLIAGSTQGSWNGSIPVARSFSPRFSSTNWRDSGNSRGHNGANFGYSGFTIEQLQPYVAPIIAGGYDLVIAQLGANNVNDGEAASVIAPKAAAMVDEFIAAGIPVILRAIGPRSTAGSANNDSVVPLGNAIYRTRLELNRLYREIADARPMCMFFDPSAALCDAASPVQQAATNVLRDGLHLSGLGALLEAIEWDEFYARCITPPASNLPIAPDSALNLFPNGLLPGTGGSNGGSVTGTAPDYTSLRRLSGTATGVTSVRAAPDGGNSVRSVITNISGDSIYRLSFNPTPATGGDPGPSNPVSGVVGKWYRASAVIYIESGADMLAHMRFSSGCRATSTGSTLEATTWAMGGSDSFLTPANGRTFYVETEPMLAPATTAYMSLEAFIYTTGTGDFVFETSAPTIREVSDPRL